MGEIVFRLFLTAVVTALIEVADYYLLGDVIVLWLSALIAFVLVFGGWLIIVDGDGW